MGIWNFFIYFPLILGFFILTIVGIIYIFDWHKDHRQILSWIAFKTLLTMALLSISAVIIGGLIFEWVNLI